MPQFDKWWDDLKKHRKRLEHWLPHWKALAAKIGDERPIRYFTLCARSMIDVFLLVDEGLLKVDPESHSISRVQFCESDKDQFTEIREMIAREDAGFLGRLEEVVLFEDDDFTAQCPNPESIERRLEDEGLQSDLQKVDRLLLKRTHFNVISSFPYDLVNLDFCQYYYPRPPDMLRINETVKRFLQWQSRASDDVEPVRVNEFILAVTCRHDDAFPTEAETRLLELIRTNCAHSEPYNDEVRKTRGIVQIEDWLVKDREDFFLSGWPKDIAASAKEYGWAMQMLDYVFYRRVGDENNPYLIACIVARLWRPDGVPDHMQPGLFALDRESRKLIPDIAPTSPEGQHLIDSLRRIVTVRNEQAQRQHRPPLPGP